MLSLTLFFYILAIHLYKNKFIHSYLKIKLLSFDLPIQLLFYDLSVVVSLVWNIRIMTIFWCPFTKQLKQNQI